MSLYYVITKNIRKHQKKELITSIYIAVKLKKNSTPFKCITRVSSDIKVPITALYPSHMHSFSSTRVKYQEATLPSQLGMSNSDITNHSHTKSPLHADMYTYSSLLLISPLIKILTTCSISII